MSNRFEKKYKGWLGQSVLRQGHAACVWLSLVLLVQPLVMPIGKAAEKQLDNFATAQTAQTVKALPLSFEQNAGQTDARVKYTARGDGYRLALTQQDARLTLFSRESAGALQSANLRMQLVNGNPRAEITPLAAVPGVSHYYRGSDQSKWVRNVKSYARVQYQAVYPGIDLVWYGQERELEYDFIVAPGANPQSIAWQFDGASRLKLDEAGNLIITTAAGELVQHAPVVYQVIDGTRRSVEGRFVLSANQQVSFALGEYDRAQTLVIDPRIGYASFAGGKFEEHFTTGVAVTRSGEAYLGGFTFSGEMFGTPTENGVELFVTKLNAQGSAAIFTVFLGGAAPSVQSLVTALAVDASDNVYATGRTRNDYFGDGFPLVNAFQEKSNPGFAGSNNEFQDAHDAFVTKINPDGEIVYSTLLGGARDDQAYDIAVTSEGRAAITGYTNSRNFPTENQFEGNVLFFSGRDIFVTVFEPEGNKLQYSTYLRSGDINEEEGRGIAVDSNGHVYVTGFTEGKRLPTRTTSGTPFQEERADGQDAFLAKFNPFSSGESSLLYATYIGGRATDQGTDVAVDAAFNAYVTGITGSTDFPLKVADGGTFIDEVNQGNEAFVMAFNPTASSLLFSTFLGGSGLETNQTVSMPEQAEELTLLGTGRIALDNQANIYVTGTTASSDFLVLNAVQPKLAGAQDMFLTKFTPGGRSVAYSTYWGGTQREFAGGLFVDSNQNVFLSGNTASSDLFVTPNAVQANFGGRIDDFIVKLNNPNADTIGVFDPAANQFFLRNSNTAGLPDLAIPFGQAGDIPVIGDWNGDGVETIGVFRQGTFLLSNSNTNPAIDVTAAIGVIGDFPIVGDWDGDGDDTVGVQRGNLFLLTNDNALITLGTAFGAVGDVALAGDWDGDGTDTLGVFRQGTFFLTNVFNNGIAEIVFSFGNASDKPIVGDWDGNGSTTVGVFRPNGRNNQFLLRNSNSAGGADVTLTFSPVSIPANPFGNAGLLPVTGDYNGLP